MNNLLALLVLPLTLLAAAPPATAPLATDELVTQSPPVTQPAPTRGGSGGVRQPDCFIISRTDESKYKVEGNIKIGDKAAQLVDMMYPKEMVKNDKSPTAKKYPGVVMFHGG